MSIPSHISEAEERSLLLRLTKNDEGAFCELYAAYKKRLVCFAGHFLQSREEAEDLFQDTFTAVWRNRHSIDPDASFSSYLFTVMRNKILNHLREREYRMRLLDCLTKQPVGSSEETDSSLQTFELQQLIAKALQQLTPRQREIFSMSRDRHLSHKEIAEALGITVNTVQDSISTSLRTIRAYLPKS